MPPPLPASPQAHKIYWFKHLPRSQSSLSLMRSTPPPVHPQVNSSSPFPEPKHGRHFSSESTYSQSSAEDSRPDAPGSGHSSGCRPMYRERRSWQDLIETPLTSSGLHFLQTGPAEGDSAGGYVGSAVVGSGRQVMSPERRRQATLPVQRRHRHDRDGPFPLLGSEEKGLHVHRHAHKQRSQSLPRNREVQGSRSDLLCGGPSEERSEDDEVPFCMHKSSGKDEHREEEREDEVADGLQELYCCLERAGLSAIGEPRPFTRQDFRRVFLKRCVLSFYGSPLRTFNIQKNVRTGLVLAKEGELAIINQVLEDPKLTSKKFREWKQRHHDLFLDICEFSSGHDGAAELSPLTPPLMTHTHSFIETHV
ncbi:hypothetical protein Z043_115435 [Scleropages formosus]|uniref:Connector enhancer of kinase suppressor of ras 2-like n=1 Tax=Scleropages formosus TaxID=113540 RepID=A0A0P7TXJ3_SCLFO|nr:hypothetical protein Z043_115435 [Scleropages formosus]